MPEDITELQKELWRVYKTIQAINEVAKERELDDEEKDKLKFLVDQFKSIKEEIAEESADDKDETEEED